MEKTIGAQYYTVRDLCQTARDFDRTCKAVSEIGYSFVQISGVPLKAEEMMPILDKYGLYVVATHRGFDDFLNNLDEVISYNKILGSTIAGIGMMPTKYADSADSLKEFITAVNEISKKLRANGLYFGYHNHALEFSKIDGKEIYDYLIEETDLAFIADTYWFQFGGKNPVEMIRRLGKRAMLVHLKDFAIKPSDYWKPSIAEIGEGNLNWAEIIDACETEGVKWAVVEQDICDGSPLDSLKISYDYLTAKGFFR